MDLPRAQARVFHAGPAGLLQLVEQFGDQPLQLGAGDLEVQVLGTARVGRDERQVDVGLHRRGQFDLGLFRGFLQALQRHLVVAQVDALVLLELVRQVADEPHVEVVAAQVGVAVGGLDLEDALADFEDGDVEGAAAQVEDRDLLFLLLVHAVGQRRRGRLVDDAQHVQPGDLAGVLGGLALAVVEVGRHGDDGVVHRFTQVVLGVLLDEGEDERGDLRRAVTACRGSRAGRPRWTPARSCRAALCWSYCTSCEANLRPISRLTPNTVFSGLVIDWRLAICPTRRSPLSVTATTEGVVRPPSGLVMTFGSPPSMIATQELVVPRSIPITFDIPFSPPDVLVSNVF